MDKTMKPTRDQILEAASAGNLQLLRDYAAQGADLNEVDSLECSLLEVVVDDLCRHSVLCKDSLLDRYEVVRTLLELGADPKVVGGDECCSPLIPAMLAMDTEMLRILLEAGADPNIVADAVTGETLYDSAEFDYRFHTYDFKYPEEFSKEERRDEDAWLQFLDRMAVKYNAPRPSHLILMRQFGAKTGRELGLIPRRADAQV